MQKFTAVSSQVLFVVYYLYILDLSPEKLCIKHRNFKIPLINKNMGLLDNEADSIGHK